MEVGTDVVESGAALCVEVNKEFRRSMIFSGKLAFRIEKYYHKFLHNETAFAIQRILTGKEFQHDTSYSYGYIVKPYY